MTAQKSFKPIVSLSVITLLMLGFFVVSGQVYAAEDIVSVAESVVVEGVNVEQVVPVAVEEEKIEEVPVVATASPVSGGGGSDLLVIAGAPTEVVSAEVMTADVPVVMGTEVVSEEVSVGGPAILGVEVVSAEITAATTHTTGGGGGPQPNLVEVVSTEISAATTAVNTGVEIVSMEVSATTYNSTIPPPGSEVVSNEVAATTLPAGPEVVSEEITARTNDAPPGGCTSNCGGGGSTPSTPSGGGGGGYIIPPTVEEEIPTTCSEYLLEYIRLGWNNNPLEVVKLQVFLNYFEGFNLPITGVYTLADFNAVSIFQARYGRDILGPWGISDSTGFVFITTRMAINNIVCHLSTENNLDLRNFYYREAARLGLISPNYPGSITPGGLATSTTGTTTIVGWLQAAAIGLLNYLQIHGGWRVIGFILILIALGILIWRLSRNVLLDEESDTDYRLPPPASPLLLANKDDDADEELDLDNEPVEVTEEIVVPSEEEEVDAVTGEEPPAGDEPISEYGQRPLDNLS